MTGEPARQDYTREQVCRLIGVRESVLEDWEARGFTGRAETYSFHDVVALRALAELRRSRIRPERIRRLLDSLRRRLGGVRNPLAELKIFTDGARVSVQVDDQRMEPVTGQLLLDFDRTELKRLLEFPGRRAEREREREDSAKRAEGEKWFEKGVHLEQTGASADQIIMAYQRAVEYDPALAGALVNLGTVYFHLKKWKEAEKYYVAAVEANPEYPLAQFNLGNLYDELGEWQKALECYAAALRLSPEYPDAHYNLALLYQGQGDSLKAVRHWRIYLKQDPSGYWAGIARRELQKLRSETVFEGSGAAR